MLLFSDLALPLIQAPMAGGFNTPDFAAAVCRENIIGSFGFAYHSPEKIRADIQATRQKASGILNANFFVFQAVTLPSEQEQRQALDALMSLPGNKDVSFAVPTPPFYPDLDKQLEAVWEEKPDILSFHFGTPSPAIVHQAHALNISVGITATNLGEAERAAASGADFIIAQGTEAGGHRGLFDPSSPDEGLGTLALVTAIKKKISLPVVASGGIMTGQDMRAALNVGAAAVQMGTAFLTCKECGASVEHKKYLLNETTRGTAFTSAYSGRPARGIKTAFMEKMEGKTILPFPVQNTVTRGMRAAAVERHDGEYQSLWAGTGYRFCRDETVKDLVQRLSREMTTTPAM